MVEGQPVTDMLEPSTKNSLDDAQDTGNASNAEFDSQQLDDTIVQHSGALQERENGGFDGKFGHPQDYWPS
jgi:hypothetical protein